MKHINCFKSVLAIWLFVSATIDLKGQATTDSVSTKNKLITLRNDFIHKIEAMGYRPKLEPPEIVMDNPQSFGNYEDGSNTLHTSNWQTLAEGDKELFTRAGKRYGMTGENYFESSAHRWIFVHELGHWWRACQKQDTDSYSSEMAANRIDIAYWRETDTAYSAFSKLRFENYVKLMPNPVPQGQDKKQYLNDNYGKLPVQAYIWYQATMILNGYNEMPIATFKESIARSGNKE